MSSNHNDLIKHEIKGRKVEYYLVTETDLEQIKSNNVVGDVAFLISSLSFGAFIAGDDSIFLLIGVLSLMIALYFYYVKYQFIQKTKDSGSIEEVETNEVSQINYALEGDSSRHQVKEKVVPQGLSIQYALYSAAGGSIDITSHLQKKIKNNTLDVVVSNDIAGDPSPGQTKTLRISYKVNGVRIVKRVKESDRLVLP